MPGAYVLGGGAAGLVRPGVLANAVRGFSCTGLGSPGRRGAGVCALLQGLGLLSSPALHRVSRMLLRLLLASQRVAGLWLLIYWGRHVAG